MATWLGEGASRDLKLLDVESGAEVEITADYETVQRYRQGLAEWFDSEVGTNEEIKTAEARLAKLRTMEKNLQQLYLEQDISHHDFKEHRARIEAERSRLTNTVDAIRQRQHLVKADFEITLQPQKSIF